MKHGTTPYHVDQNGYHLSLDGVPAWICIQCGEPYFETAEVDQIQNTIRLLDERMTKVKAAA
jgi:YgiT-type zinc finger domain-containing protein